MPGFVASRLSGRERLSAKKLTFSNNFGNLEMLQVAFSAPLTAREGLYRRPDPELQLI